MGNKKVLSTKEKVVVTSGKGGVGKSTYSSQVVAAFLHSFNGGKKVKYIEVDDANKSANLYENSNILSGEKIPVSKDLDLSLAMQSNENVVIDIGGNKTTEIVIKNIGENEDFDDVSWVIPLDRSKDGAQNAFKTFSQIMDIYEDSQSVPKILFVLNGSSNILEKDPQELEQEFAYFFGSEWMKLDFILRDNLPKAYQNSYTFFDNFEKILISTALQKLAVEIGTDEYKQDAKEQKSLRNSEYIAIEEKFKAGKATQEELDLAKINRVKAFDIFQSTKKIQAFVKDSINPQYPKLLDLVAG